MTPELATNLVKISSSSKETQPVPASTHTAVPQREPQSWERLNTMSRSEILSPEGLRLDGRRPGEIRRLRCQMSAEPKADGSAYLEQGNTKVLVTVCGPHEVSSQRKAQHDRAVLNCTYAALPFAGGQHKQGRGDRAAAELAAAVRSVFEPVVQIHQYPRTQIDVSITLLQADGGVRPACINATTLALIDAGIAMEDFVCACTAGAIQSALLLDMNAQEDMGAPSSPRATCRAPNVWATCSSSRRCRSRAQTS